MVTWLLFPLLLEGQEISLGSISTKWENDLSEWEIFDSNNDLVGKLDARWANQQDWSEWDFFFDELTGQIRQKWAPDNNEWELRTADEIITCRTIWRNQFNQWRISGGN